MSDKVNALLNKVTYDDALILPPHVKRLIGGVLPMSVLDTTTGLAIPSTICGTNRLSSATYVPKLEKIEHPTKLSGRWLFGGVASQHFGHQITRSLGRLAAFENCNGLEGVVFAGLDRQTSKIGNLTMFSDLLAGLGVNLKPVVLSEPTLIEQLVVGPDLFSELTEGIADPRFVEWSRSVFLPPTIVPAPGSKLYVTRTQLDPTLGRVFCEEVIERNLLLLGFEIYAPERHSVADQIKKYASSETIITTDGSHGHLIAFSRQSNQRIITIARRFEEPKYLTNHLSSYSLNLEKSEHHFLMLIKGEWWNKVRAENRAKVEIDFAKLRDELIFCGAIPERARKSWRIPSAKAIEDSKTLGLLEGETLLTPSERILWLREIRANRRLKKLKERKLLPIPTINGLRYFRMLSRIHAVLKPEWYLEVGTFTGKSLAIAICNTVAVDPSFKIERPVINATSREMHFMQMTSDEFFLSEFAKRYKPKFDFAFLDGLHLFEYLLRDFINAEKLMQNGGVIALHDCCPTTSDMETREYKGGNWTGDVWKTLLILLEHRPDLDIQVSSAAPTGLTVIRNLDPKSKILEELYNDLIDQYMNLTLTDLDGGIGGLYQKFELKTPEEVIDSLTK